MTALANRREQLKEHPRSGCRRRSTSYGDPCDDEHCSAMLFEILAKPLRRSHSCRHAVQLVIGLNTTNPPHRNGAGDHRGILSHAGHARNLRRDDDDPPPGSPQRLGEFRRWSSWSPDAVHRWLHSSCRRTGHSLSAYSAAPSHGVRKTTVLRLADGRWVCPAVREYPAQVRRVTSRYLSHETCQLPRQPLPWQRAGCPRSQRHRHHPYESHHCPHSHPPLRLCATFPCCSRCASDAHTKMPAPETVGAGSCILMTLNNAPISTL